MIQAPIQTLVAEIGSMFGSGEERPATIMGTIGVQLATLTRRGLLNCSGFPLLVFLIVAMCSGSWGACNYSTYSPYNSSNNPSPQWCKLDPNNGIFLPACSSMPGCTGAIIQASGYYYYDCWINCSGSNVCGGVPNVSSTISENETRCHYQCSTQNDADSLKCINEGKVWQNGQCMTCPNDTTWQEISCAYSVQRGQYLNVVNTYGIRDCETYSRSQQYYSPTCDSIGADSAYTCIGTVDGENVYMRTPWGTTFSCAADGSCARAQQMIAAGECKAPKQPLSSSSEPTSSSESNQSSSSSEPTSSSEGGLSSSDSGEGNHVIIDELPERLYDSLGHIDYNIEFMQPFVTGIYDATWEMSGTLHDVNQNTRSTADNTAGILDKSTNIDNKLSTTNSLLTDIKNKNWSPSINVQAPNVNVENNIDVSGIQNRQDQTRDTLHNTNSLLEQIKGLLGLSGSDTIHVDTSKAPASIDSAMKFWGNKNNQNFGTAGLDTSGWGNTNDSAKVATDSALSQGTWTTAMGCDTTGGRKCDGAIIGQHGLDSAKNGIVNAYHGLGDTLRDGAFGDSLRQWGDKFKGGVITGSGSQNCPSVLSRSYRVTIIGETGFDFTLGNYLCSPIFGSVTAWALCRLLLRAGVALACMWFLFKCATGFKGQGEDD